MIRKAHWWKYIFRSTIRVDLQNKYFIWIVLISEEGLQHLGNNNDYVSLGIVQIKGRAGSINIKKLV